MACVETPLKFEDVSGTALNDLKRSNACPTCKVRLTSLLAGTGFVRPISQGLSFDSPQTTLEFNGVRHSIEECILTFPAMHCISIPGMPYSDISGAELQVRFRGETTTTNNSRYVLVMPIRIGDGVGAELFASLDVIQRSRPTLGSLVTDTPFLLYKGVDVAGLTKKNKVCDDSRQKVFYLTALKPLHMRIADYVRLKAKAEAGEEYKMGQGPAIAGATLPDAKKALISYIPNIIVTAAKLPKTKTPYVQTAQVKCRPLDMTRDIKGDTLYVGGPGQYKTLKDELASAADPTLGIGEPEASFDVSRVESILAIVLGVLLGIVIISFIAWYVFKWTTAHYPQVATLYQRSNPLLKIDSLNK